MSRASRTAQARAVKSDDNLHELVKCLEPIAYRRNMQEVFFDLIQMVKICYANAYLHSPKLEEEYLAIIKRYNPEEQKLFCKAFAFLVLYADSNPMQDLFSEIFQVMNFNSAELGQFFTPACVSDLMASIVDTELVDNWKAKGYVNMLEPTCGSGISCLAFARRCKVLGINPQQDCIITGMDIDSRCVAMCFCNLAINHIPAIICHADTLRMEIYETYYTPAYWTSGMCWRYKKEDKKCLVKRALG